MTISKFIVDMNFKKIIVKVNYHTSYIVREKIIYWEKEHPWLNHLSIETNNLPFPSESMKFTYCVDNIERWMHF